MNITELFIRKTDFSQIVANLQDRISAVEETTDAGGNNSVFSAKIPVLLRGQTVQTIIKCKFILTQKRAGISIKVKANITRIIFLSVLIGVAVSLAMYSIYQSSIVALGILFCALIFSFLAISLTIKGQLKRVIENKVLN